MTDIRRFDFVTDLGVTSIEEHPLGDYVRFEDHEAALQRAQERAQTSKKRYIIHCDNGHRSTVPHDAMSFEGGTTHACPECGIGLRINEPVMWQRFDKQAGCWDYWTYIAWDDAKRVEHYRHFGQPIRPLYDRGMEGE